jgi:predicted dehydrogenase
MLKKNEHQTTMNRRDFIKKTTATLAAPAIMTSASRLYADEFGGMKKRVALIGSGWYGKCDLLRLVQVAPIDVVSISDVDQTMLSDAADLIATRQISKKKPRTYTDYRKQLAEKDADLVIIGTPDHWHALPMIEAVQKGMDVYVQKPTGVGVIESQAMLAAARKYQRVVQVGTQRRSTPHLIEARDRVVKAGLLGQVGLVEICCYYHMRTRENPPDSTPPANFDYDMWTGPAPMRPYNKLVHPRSWRAFNEYGNGIVGDMCVHMLDTTRWLLDLGWPERISSTGGILVQKDSKANISDTQHATFEFGSLPVVWTHRTYGDAPDPKYPWAVTIYGEKGTLKASIASYDFIPKGGSGTPLSGSALMELEKYPEDQTEKDLEKNVAAAIRGHMQDFLRRVADRGRPVADIEQGHISSASCFLANISMDLKRSLQWDSTKHQVIGDAEANAKLRRPYRAPWVHPEPDQV